MKWKTKFIETMKRYKHAWVFLYALIYMPWFWFLEKHVTMNYHVVQTALDEEIPFIEYFIVPYMLWFVFIAATFLYFFFTDVQGFYKLAKISFAGMTIFLIICSVFPNGQDLRPVVLWLRMARADLLGTKPCSAITASTLALVWALTLGS